VVTLEAPGRPTIEVTATPCRHGPPLSHPLVGDVMADLREQAGAAQAHTDCGAGTPTAKHGVHIEPFILDIQSTVCRVVEHQLSQLDARRLRGHAEQPGDLVETSFAEGVEADGQRISRRVGASFGTRGATTRSRKIVAGWPRRARGKQSE
jgi:hypothetical protein